MNTKIEKIEDLGYDNFFEIDRIKLGFSTFDVARVISVHKGAYRVKNLSGIYLAKISGKKMFRSKTREDYPAVGDWVVISNLKDQKAMIQEILPRKTVIKRKSSAKDYIQVIATNIDIAFIVESVDRDYNLNRFERYFAIVEDGGIEPVIIINKIDLLPEEKLRSIIDEIKNRFKNTEVYVTSIVTGEGINSLRSNIKKGKTYCFLGSSGVGKSSIINYLIDEKKARVGNISSYSGRGKHITTTREMYFLENGGIVIDNPGMREVGMTNTNKGINSLFDEINVLAKNCKFADCTHTHEPGCEILSALESGELDKEQYLNYIRLKKEAKHFEMTKIERKEKDRQFGKFVNKTKKELKKYGHKNYVD